MGEKCHKSHHELPLSLIKTPLSDDQGEVTHDVEHSESNLSYVDSKQMSITTSHLSNGARPHPVFKRHSESTPSELFYDLFFVANLTTFTNAHEINDHQSKSSIQ